MRGIVVFLESDTGTKSESLQPYLYLGGGELTRLFKKGDNPFENESIWPFDTMTVSVSGEQDKNGKLWVETIAVDKNKDMTDSDNNHLYKNEEEETQ